MSSVWEEDTGALSRDAGTVTKRDGGRIDAGTSTRTDGGGGTSEVHGCYGPGGPASTCLPDSTPEGAADPEVCSPAMMLEVTSMEIADDGWIIASGNVTVVAGGPYLLHAIIEEQAAKMGGPAPCYRTLVSGTQPFTCKMEVCASGAGADPSACPAMAGAGVPWKVAVELGIGDPPRYASPPKVPVFCGAGLVAP